MAVSLDFIPPFEPGIFDFLAARALAGVEEADSLGYSRTLQLCGGHGWFRVEWDGKALWLEHDLQDPADAGELLAKVRHLLNLDHDPRESDLLLSTNPLFAPRVAALPGIRLPGCVDPAEILIRAMIGQQITVAAARTALDRLMVLGARSGLPHESMLSLFPQPGDIAAGGREILGGPQRRIDSIVGVAQLLASGKLAIGKDDTVDSLAEKLLPIPGIGPWTVGYVAMRVLGSTDVFLPTDAAVRNGFARLQGDGLARSLKPAALTKLAAPLQPWRSYATMHLWRLAGEKPPPLPLEHRVGT